MEDDGEDEGIHRSREIVRNRVRQCLLNILQQFNVRNVESECLENIQYRLEWLLSVVTRYYQCGMVEATVIDCIREALGYLSSPCITSNNFQVDRVSTGNSGRPRFDIAYEQLDFLVERRFTVKQMAMLLGVSERTIERRMQEFSISIRASYSNITQDELDSVVRETLSVLPNTGYKRMTGYLLARGLRMQQHKVRDSMRRVDPQGH